MLIEKARKCFKGISSLWGEADTELSNAVWAGCQHREQEYRNSMNIAKEIAKSWAAPICGRKSKIRKRQDFYRNKVLPFLLQTFFRQVFDKKREVYKIFEVREEFT